MSQTILCIEDEEDTGNLIQALLEREGYTIVRARDGRQALCLFETMRPPALILLDVVIPYVNGFEQLSTLRNNPDWQHTPIIMVSADYYQPDIQRALAEGATAYVVKKPGLQDLIHKVRQVLSATPITSTTMPTPVTVCAEATPSPFRQRRAPSRRSGLATNRPRKRRAA
jgi:CheY-like chemotaxis protein